MLIIGERINSTREHIREAIKNRNASYILKEVKAQIAAGAGFIDINCAVSSTNELADMDWVVSIVQSEINDVSLCIDSPSYLAIEKGLSIYKGGGRVMVNSITGEESRIANIVPLAAKYNAKLIALTMDDKGMPETALQRLEIAKRILKRVKEEGFNEEDLYFDPLIRPISTEPGQAKEVLDAIPMIKGLGRVKTTCGLSNISFGLPHRHLINSVFLSMAIQSGLDAAILDPLDKKVVSSAVASEALMGKDEYCADYIKAFREGKLA